MIGCRCSARTRAPIRFVPFRRSAAVTRRAVLRPEDWSSGESDTESMPELSSSKRAMPSAESKARVAELYSPAESNINPVTGNPQTGKLIDVYFEVSVLMLVVVLGGLSYLNASHIISQTEQADMMRMPAAKEEWLAHDSKDVYGPCGGDQGSDAAMRSLLDGKPCHPSTYQRAPPAAQLAAE